MTRTGLLSMAAVVAGLAAVVGLELRTGTGDEGTMDLTPPSAAPSSPLAAAPPAAANHTRDWVQTILTRPLFAPYRRPAAAMASGGAPSTLPRVAGILLDGGRRSVIFAAAEGGKPQVLAEGADVAGYRVRSIESGQVTLVGPDGPLILRPSFDPTPRPAAAPAPGQGLPGLPGLPVFGAPVGPAAR